MLTKLLLLTHYSYYSSVSACENDSDLLLSLVSQTPSLWEALILAKVLPYHHYK